MASTTELEARVRELEERLRSMEGGAKRTARTVIDEIFPTETRKHMRAAWKEELLALRSVLDHWIARSEDGGAEKAKRRESISVE
jgi:hypothetical protein